MAGEAGLAVNLLSPSSLLSSYGALGLFVMLFFVFVRLLPMISMFEIKQIIDKPEVGVE